MILFVVDFRKDTYTKNILMRTLWVDKSDDSSLDFDQINFIDHVVFHDSTKYLNSTSIRVSEFDYEGLRGEIDVHPLIEKNELHIVKGRNIENDYEALCPQKFYPHNMYLSENNTLKLKIVDSQILNGEDFIGTEFNLYSVNPEHKNHPTNIKVKIVGTYDTYENLGTLNSCYISLKNYDQIASPYNGYIEAIDINNNLIREYNEYSGRMVRVDNYNHVNAVANELTQLGFSVSPAYFLDETYLKLILYIPFFISIVVIVVSFALIYNFMNKKIRTRKNYYGFMRVIGYNQQELKRMEMIENTILCVFSFLASFFLYIILYLVINEKLLGEFMYHSVKVNVPFVYFLFSTILLILFVNFIIKRLLDKQLKRSISILLKKE